ncbi:MAG TPA: M48 family metallopeptidase [Nitrospirales bacterium]|jgi:hypothetical protein
MSHSFYRCFPMVLAAGLLAACTTNPYTNRSQLVLFTDDTKEMALGAEAQGQILKDPKVNESRDPAQIASVKLVAQRIIDAAKRSKYSDRAQKFAWEVHVIKADKTINAFVVPGGKIFVYTGIFSIADNEAGLAAILGHEVTHALALHGSERKSQGMLAQGFSFIAGVAATYNGINGGAVQDLSGAVAKLGILLPYSRVHESEADYVGMLLAADAGYDPHEAVRVWQRMAQVNKDQSPEFLSTHPSDGTRITQMQGWMNEALTYYRPAPGRAVQKLPPIGFPSVRVASVPTLSRSGGLTIRPQAGCNSPCSSRHETKARNSPSRQPRDLSSLSYGEQIDIQRSLIQWRRDLDQSVEFGELSDEEADELYIERQDHLRRQKLNRLP